MTQSYIVTIDHGNAETTIGEILAHIWSQSNRSGILIPAITPENELPKPTFIQAPEDLPHTSMLAPYMPYNAAANAVELLQENPGAPLALALKPCELRSLKEYARQKAMALTSVITISADCLAVYPPEDIGWRLADGAFKDLTDEVLRFAPQGGILLSRFQQSCQVCERPYPIEADVQFELIGLDVSQHIIVSVKDPAWLEGIDLQLESVSPDLRSKRQRILENLVDWRSKALKSAGDKLDPEIASPDGLMAHLKQCPDCQGQLEAMCLQFQNGVLNSRETIVEWVGTCSGCGTCDYHCPSHYPLFTVIAHLHDRYARRENSRIH
jgi:formate dehydrogenase subunit beta